MFRIYSIVFLAFCFLPGQAQDIVRLTYYPDAIEVKPLYDFKTFTFTANGRDQANCVEFSIVEDGGGFLIRPYDERGEKLPDGIYKFRLGGNPGEPVGDPKYRFERCKDDDPVNVFQGTFTVYRGEFLDPNEEEKREFSGKKASGDNQEVRQGTRLGTPLFDQVINDDLIVDGSACIGFDCVNGEVFGFDTIRLKENNLRIKFEDTSVAAGFPTNDWQLTANDSASGGASKFSIDDISGNRTPFTVEAGAPSHSLYVDDGGRLGLGTSTPSVEIHAISGDSPTLRLQQDGTSGFAPQTWDVAGNETNFFIRDATNGSTLPFRIRPGADSSSIFIDTDSSVGMGTASPAARLHVDTRPGDDHFLINDVGSGDTTFLVDEDGHVGIGQDPDVDLFVVNVDGAGDPDLILTEDGNLGLRSDPGANQFQIVDDSPVIFNMQYSMNPSSNYNTTVNNTGFSINRTGAGVTFQITNSGTVRLGDGLLVEIDNAGNVTATSHMNSSDVNLKEDFEVIDPRQILDKVIEMPVTAWQFKESVDPEGRRHIGPMAQDFHAAFGLGKDDTAISTTDMNGVTMAAIQGLNLKIEAKDAEITRMSQQLEAKESVLSQVNAKLRAQEQQLRDQEARLKALEKLLNP
jgi:hypothetical protein